MLLAANLNPPLHMPYAPIALFTYCRAEHTRRTVASLLANAGAAESDLFIFSDGPKSGAVAPAVADVRRYIHSITGFRTVTVVEREGNWGLARSLIAGITELTERFGRIIVVEDDLLLSPHFLAYMNGALDKYERDGRVSAIAAHVTDTGTVPTGPFFLRFFECWGWATWRRAWRLLDTDARRLLWRLRWKTREFNVGGSGPYYGILYCQKAGLVDSWAICFYASSFLAGKLVLYPPQSLTLNTGLDGSGTHSRRAGGPGDTAPTLATPVALPDIEVRESPLMYSAYARHYRGDRPRRTWPVRYARLKSAVRRLLCIDCL